MWRYMMNLIIKHVLIGAAKTLLGSDVWQNIRDLVNQMANDKNLTGDEKRAMVFMTLKETGVRAVSFLINLGIEIAVALLDDNIKKWENS